jgi:hypothetical protein
MKYINYLYEKANGVTIFFIMGAISALISYVMFYSLILTDPTPKLTTDNILAISLIFGVLGGLLFVTSILSSRKSTKFWDYAELVEAQIDAADSKEALEYIHKGEFEILRTLCMGGPQISELNRLFTIMKTKYKYVK